MTFTAFEPPDGTVSGWSGSVTVEGAACKRYRRTNGSTLHAAPNARPLAYSSSSRARVSVTK